MNRPGIVWRGRRVTSSTLLLGMTTAACCIASATWIALPLLLLAAVGALPGQPLIVLVAVAIWSGLALVAVLPGVSSAVAIGALGLVAPTGPDRVLLDANWRTVCARAGVAAERFMLRIDPSTGINALAAGSSLVAVTPAAVHLPPGELRAILAHELGHHHDHHATLFGVQFWFLLPLIAVDRLLAALARRLANVPMAGPLVRWLHVVLVTTMMLPIRVVALVAALGSRRAELDADAFCAELGGGSALSRLLSRFEQPEVHVRVWRTLLLTHPQPADRIRALHGRGRCPMPARRAPLLNTNGTQPEGSGS